MDTQNSDLGRRVGAYRRLKGFTAEDLASRVEGLTRVGLSKIETGQRPNVPLDLVNAIAWELGVSPLVLLYPLEDPHARITINGDTIRTSDLLGVLFGTILEGDGTSEADDAVLTSASIVTANRRLTSAFEAIERFDDERAIEQARENAESQYDYLDTLARMLWKSRRRGDDQ